jgi:hypothetical protein
MATTTTTLSCLLCCLLATSLAMPKKSEPEVSLRGLDEERLPLNTVVLQGNNATFTCSSLLGTNARIQWFEYISTPGGSLISDGSLVLPGHPNSARFSLDTSSPRQFDLTVINTVRADAGRYECVDSNAPVTEKKRQNAELTVIEDYQQCTTTLPPSSTVIEGTYYTYECTINYGGNFAPSMIWSGPSPFGQAQSDNGVRVWNGLSFVAQRSMNGQYWASLANFKEDFVDILPPDSATNVPVYEEEHRTPRIEVNWPPTNMYADPVKPLNEYNVGDVIQCYADAFPSPTFSWHNLRTNERIEGSILTIPQSYEGNENPMRCDAYNTINGFRFNRELHITVHVPTPPTTPTTTPPTTTTPPPAESPCFNLKGRWESTGPTPAFMCLEVDEANGNIHGVLRNDTDTHWLDLIGSTNLPTYDHASFSAIWAQNKAVSTFIGECHRCYGTEYLIVSAISRSKGGPPCGQPGQIFYSQEYEFRRNPSVSCPPITIPTFDP